jgi:rhodanese-related sulfurtransferase
VDDEEVRAPMTAQWLRQLGHEACVLEGGVAAAMRLGGPGAVNVPYPPEPASIRAPDLGALLHEGSVQLVDLRPGMSYRKEHIAGAAWSIRPRVTRAIADRGRPVVLVADEPAIAALAALDLGEAGVGDVRMLAGGHEAARSAGIPVASTPGEPSDADCIDFLFFTHGRHEGDAAAARQYLAWEIGLVDQLDAQERGSFSLSA